MTVDPSKLTPYKDIAAANASLRQISEDAFYVINEVVTRRLGHMPILKVNRILITKFQYV
jgi:hypothetical protein